jgi:cytochrome c oxidase subunit II
MTQWFSLIVVTFLAQWPRLRPEVASVQADRLDHLFFFLTGVTLFFTFLIFGTIFYFMIKYRRRSETERPPETRESFALEMTWIVIPTLITIFIFFWGARLFFDAFYPPQGAMEIFVVGKQWMWHLQHPEGPREINQLHVPVNVPVLLTMTSEDVIHGFFIPAFRIKRDVVPGRYLGEWFEATEPGSYHLFCTQYCGALHSGMRGTVEVMTPDGYAQWLRDNATPESMAQMGEQLFARLGCDTCHLEDGTGPGPALEGRFEKPQTLANGQIRVMDESYIRQAILDPGSLPLPNYRPIMPTFRGQVSEEQILQLIAYIKSLASGERTQAP